MDKRSKRFILSVPLAAVLGFGLLQIPSATAKPQAAQVYSGYSAQPADEAPIKSVTARWTQPAISCNAFASLTGGLENMIGTGSALIQTPGMLANPLGLVVTQFVPHMSYWVGLVGGEGRDMTLIQTGTSAACVLGVVEYGGFFEAPSLRNQKSPEAWTDPGVAPGDVMRATVTWDGADSYRLVLENTTAGWSKEDTMELAGITPQLALAVGETIPCNSPDFTPVEFTEVTADGKPFGDYEVRSWSISPCTPIAPGPLEGESFTITQPEGVVSDTRPNGS
ncbi:G1 family glutamic endopeptidase [Nocardia sp. XZ_19_385]|uniref:G1 family glutamic endopeptidase n=1 Tax=Nocardia sp. XZ_19_385 TaxID=2769488 RepID=UPI00189082B5|nr:G1 family glutamic endopeptidase [Nocardia sp. XZ_19_385]